MAESVFKSSGSVTTILGMMNQFQSFANLDEYRLDLTTTLNAKYGVMAAVEPPSVPLLRYFGIGIQGYKNMDGNQGARPYTPSATDMDLYTPIPFRCVPVETDLSATERQQYRMRVVRTYNGVNYALYYLKLINWNPGVVQLIAKDATTGAETEYSLNPEHLNPTPTSFNVGGSVDTNTKRIIVRATGICEVTGAEVMEYVTAFCGGVLNNARISEIGFYTGTDVTSDQDTTKEAVYVQLAKKRCTLGTDLSDPNSIMRPYVSFEASCCIDPATSTVATTTTIE